MKESLMLHCFFFFFCFPLGLGPVCTRHLLLGYGGPAVSPSFVRSAWEAIARWNLVGCYIDNSFGTCSFHVISPITSSRSSPSHNILDIANVSYLRVSYSVSEG